MSDTRTTEELRYAFISDLKAVWADDNLMCIEEYDRIIETYDTITARLEALGAERDRAETLLAAYVGARDFDDGCLCPECVAAIDKRLADAHELADNAERVMNGD